LEPLLDMIHSWASALICSTVQAPCFLPFAS
jgi:hypothetical protein